MSVYLLTVVWIFVFGLIQGRNVKLGDPLSNGERKVITPFIYLLPLAGALIFVGGFRYNVGTDFWSYYMLFRPTYGDIVERFQQLDEPIIYALTYYCRLLWDEGIFVIFVEQALTILLVFKGLREHNTKNYTLPLLLYIFYCGWLFTFNGVRQGLAVALIFAFSGKKGKFWYLRYALVCFVAFLIHKTALLMIPFLLLSGRKFDWLQILFLIVAGVAIYLGGDMAYTYMGGTAENVGDYATNDINFVRVLVAFVPPSICIIALFKGLNGFLSRNKTIINLVAFNAVIMIATMGSAYINRFSYYTMIYNMVLIPKMEDIFEEKSKRLFLIMVFILFFAYFLYETRSVADFQWAFGNFGKY